MPGTRTAPPDDALNAGAAGIAQTAELPTEAPPLPKLHRLQSGMRGELRAYPLRRLLAPVIDVSMLILATIIVSLVSPTTSPTGSGNIPVEPLGWSIAFSLVVLAIFALRGMYVPALRLELSEEARLVFGGTAVAVTVLITARALLDNAPWSAAETVRHWFVVLPLLAAGRGAVLLGELRARRNGVSGWPTLIIGAGRVGRLTAKRLLDEPELGLHPIGFLDDDPLEASEAGELPVFGDDWNFERIVSEHGVRHVVITFSMASHEALLAIARRCWELGVTVSVVPRLFEIEGERVTTERLGGLPLVAVRPVNPKGWQFAMKYTLDRLAATLALLILLPLLAAIALAIRVSLGSPIFYRQKRVGRDGHEFEMLKFRTMHGGGEHDGEADADWAAEQLAGSAGAASEPADRHTPIGRLLRRFALDELPQLWNVARGDMSLIGPRPERASYAQRFQEGIHRYRDRHRVKSGLTGWAQVNGLRGKTSLADRVEWDNYYIENWSLWLDFKILVRTIACLARGEGE